MFPKKQHRLGWLIPLLATVGLLVLFGLGTWQIGRGAVAEERTALEERLHRAAVHCYAVEGRYPPSLEYLCLSYGVRVDESKYYVFYERPAANLMPEITVVDAEEGSR